LSAVGEVIDISSAVEARELPGAVTGEGSKLRFRAAPRLRHHVGAA
jgi:hypothetical protein